MKDDFEEMRKQMLNEVKDEIKSGYSNEQYTLIQAMNAYDEVIRSYNLFSERLSEWSGIYYPGIRVQSANSLASLIKIFNNSKEISVDSIDSVINDRGKSESLYNIFTNSRMRKDLNAEESAIIENYCDMIKSTYKSLNELEEYINNTSKRLLPNVTYLTNGIIAAELLNKAGSIEKLSIMPSSTVQLLGAENALFKHIKFGSKPPKYGLLFKLPDVNTARKDLKGRIARVYANKITIAIKADVYTKNFIGEKLKDDLENSIKRITALPVKPKKTNYNSFKSDKHFKNNRINNNRIGNNKHENIHHRSDNNKPNWHNKNKSKNKFSNKNFKKHN